MIKDVTFGEIQRGIELTNFLSWLSRQKLPSVWSAKEVDDMVVQYLIYKCVENSQF